MKSVVSYRGSWLVFETLAAVVQRSSGTSGLKGDVSRHSGQTLMWEACASLRRSCSWRRSRSAWLPSRAASRSLSLWDSCHAKPAAMRAPTVATACTPSAQALNVAAALRGIGNGTG